MKKSTIGISWFNKEFRMPGIILLTAFFMTSGILPDALTQEKKIDIYGYYEPQLTGFVINDSYLQMMSNKLRVDLDTDISDRLTFNANFDYITYHGTTTYFMTDYLPDEITGNLPPFLRNFYTLTFKDRSFLDNVFLKIAFNHLDLTVGKQQISPGTGYAWNPTDIYNFKDVLDPTYEQPGQNAIRLDIPITGNNSVSLFYSPEENFRRSGKIVHVKWNIGHFDLSVMGGLRYRTWTDYLTFSLQNDRRRIVGGDIVGELFGMGVWAETAYNGMEVSENYFEGLAGFDYTFESGLYILNEFYRNEQGKPDYRKYTFNDWMRNFTAEKKAMARDQWFLYFSYPATDLLSLGASAVTSLNDGSAVIMPTLIYNLDNNIDVTMIGNAFIGSERKAFSSKLGSGGFIRLRYYF